MDVYLYVLVYVRVYIKYVMYVENSCSVLADRLSVALNSLRYSFDENSLQKAS